MIEQPHLMPECDADTLLANMLIKSSCNHQRGISLVFTAFKNKFKDRKAVGIVDDDKKKDDYYKQFKVEEETDCYKYLIHPNGCHFLIVIKKDIEDLIIKCAAAVNVNHRLVNDRKLLKQTTKDIHLSKNSEFKNLLNTLIQKQAPALLRIREILLSHIN